MLKNWNNFTGSQCCSIDVTLSNKAKLFKAAAFLPTAAKADVTQLRGGAKPLHTGQISPGLCNQSAESSTVCK